MLSTLCHVLSIEVHAIQVEEGQGYAMHVLSFGNDADCPSQARRKRTAPQERNQSGKPPRKRVRLSVSVPPITS